MSLTKDHLISALNNHCSLSKKQSSILVESLLEIIKKTLESGEGVLISGFGKFCVNRKNKRKGRNPATGNDLMLDARKVVTFRCSDRLKIKINNK